MRPLSHQEIDDLAKDYGNDFTPDVARGLDRLRSRTGAARTAKVRPLPVRRWLAVAASVLVLISAGFFFLSADGVVIENTEAGPMAVELPDGSSVILQSGSSLSYDGAYAGAEREVELAGQGYFVVKPDAERPFLVTNNETTLRVTGTAFNLRVTEGDLEVEVSEGSVELAYDDVIVPVTANRCGIAKLDAAPTSMDAPNLNRHAWRTGKLTFENAPVRAALDALYTNWDVHVSLPEGCDFPISFTYNTIDIETILDNIATLSGGTVQHLGDKEYELTGVCN